MADDLHGRGGVYPCPSQVRSGAVSEIVKT